MKIIKHMLGNSGESFVEDRFSKGVNIISSDDNNMGKTVLIQSLMFALGNEPIFPESFDYKNYYHIIYIEVDTNVVKICRKKNSFAVLYKGNLHAFEQGSEYKYFLDNNLFKLPKIFKDFSSKTVDPVLFYQTFFIGQDSRKSSNIANNGYYNKNDFINMLYSLAGIGDINEQLDEKKTKKKIKELESEQKVLLSQSEIMTTNSNAVNAMSMFKDRQSFEAKINEVKIIKEAISELKKRRNKSVNRMTKNEITLMELNSLNRTIDHGEIVCLECGSRNIGYSMGDNSSTFDISSVDIRNQILESVKNRIGSYEEEIAGITKEINQQQHSLQELLREEEITLESLLMLKVDFADASELDERLVNIDEEVSELKALLKISVDKDNDGRSSQKDLLKKLYDEMNRFYRIIDPNGNMNYTALFTTAKAIYSGSEETEFYLAKLFAIRETFGHDFPIVIDHFRARELSTKKEKNAINIMKGFGNQAILTVTLKDEERDKYKGWDGINSIDYSDHTTCKLLGSDSNDIFTTALNEFSIVL